jgi:hypothetical protein
MPDISLRNRQHQSSLRKHDGKPAVSPVPRLARFKFAVRTANLIKPSSPTSAMELRDRMHDGLAKHSFAALTLIHV